MESAQPRTFDLSDVLSVTTGRLVSSRGIDGVYDILGFLHGRSLFTHELPGAKREAEPVLRRLLPAHYDEDMAASLCDLQAGILGCDRDRAMLDVVVSAWVECQRDRLGRTVTLLPLAHSATAEKNPLDALVEMVGADKVVVAGGPMKSRHQTPGRGGSAPIGDRPRVSVHWSIDAALLEALRERARTAGSSVSQAANEAIKRGLEEKR